MFLLFLPHGAGVVLLIFTHKGRVVVSSYAIVLGSEILGDPETLQ